MFLNKIRFIQLHSHRMVQLGITRAKVSLKTTLTGDYILSQGSSPLKYTIPSSGKNSGAFIIVGFRQPGTSAWTELQVRPK